MSHRIGCAMVLTLGFSATAWAQSITVDATKRHQTMTGWEVTPRGWEIDKANNRYDPSWPHYAPQVVGRMVNELGINRIRLGVASGWENPVDYFTKFVNNQITYTEMQSHWYEKINDNNDPSTVNPQGFQFAEFDSHVENIVLPMRNFLAASGETLFVNICYVDFRGALTGNISHALNPAEYAEIIQVYFDRLRTKYGIVPDALEIILEPENTLSWRGTQIGQGMVAAVNRLRSAGYTLEEVIAPSCASPGNAIPYFQSLAQVPGSLGFMTTLSYHRYGSGDLGAIFNTANANGFQTAMLEYIDGHVGHLLDDLTVGNASAWQKWGLATKILTNGHYYYQADFSNPASPTFRMEPNTHFLRPYFRFIRRGAVRIGASSSASSMRPVAFIQKDGNYVVVVKRDAAGVSAPVSITGLRPGTYGLQVTTYGRQVINLPDAAVGANGTLTVTLSDGFLTAYGKSVGSGNIPPTARLSATPSTGTAPLSVGFSGATSSDPDGSILSYAWSFGDGANGSGATSSHLYAAAGTYTATLTVTDNGGATHSASVNITVTSAGGEIIVDNRDANTTSTGTWSVSSVAGHWGADSVWSGSGTFRWIPNVPASGSYRVYAWWTSASNRPTRAPYKIAHAAGSTTVFVNQRDPALHGKWNLLGNFAFNAGSAGSVEVSRGDGVVVSADAVRLVPGSTAVSDAVEYWAATEAGEGVFADGGSEGGCGATGLETLLILGFICLIRRRRGGA